MQHSSNHSHIRAARRIQPVPHGPRQSGFNLLEVMVGILIFVIGIIALASLQGNLTRSAADAIQRTAAINIAEEIIESQRAFARIVTDPDGVFPAYLDIVSGSSTVTREGLDYTVVTTVTEYYYDVSTDRFVTIAPLGVTVSDYKQLVVAVSWGAGEFRVIEGQETTGRLGSGIVTVSESISSVTTAAASKVMTYEEKDLPIPGIDYSPGQLPDITVLSLGDDTFKEAMLPEPDVIRLGELVETRFDVVTYSGSIPQFRRREEFVGVSCECELKVPPAQAEAAGRRPAIWLGDEYRKPEFVAKPYGISANSIQSPLCDTCCQDHHDGGSGANDPAGDGGAILFNPFRPAANYYASGAFAGDHLHYKKDRRGDLSLAELDGDIYVEACKMVRVDGFFRAAQDFRQEGLNVFQHDFLDETLELDAYSAYTTGAVSAFVSALGEGYEAAPPALAPPSRTPFGISPVPVADLTADHTFLPTVLSQDFQQLRSRGIYLDYLSEDLRDVIGCLDGGGSAGSCKYGEVALDRTGSENILEMLPFFEVQLTYLNRWRENPPNDPVDTTNEALETGNTHSRGVVSKVATVGSADVYARGHMGVEGLTDTDPIDLSFASNVRESDIRVIVNHDNKPPPNGRLITGFIVSGVSGLQGTNVEISWADMLCNRTPDGFDCLVPNGSSDRLLTVSNYKKPNRTIVACSAGLPVVQSGLDVDNNPFTVFNLSGVVDGGTYTISLEEDFCDTG